MVLTDTVINVEPVFGSPLVVHFVVLRLGNNPALITADFEFSACHKAELVGRETKNHEEKFAAEVEAEGSHFFGPSGEP